MTKRPIRITILSIFALFISFENFIFISPDQPFFMIIAVVYLFLSIGLLFLLNWVRIISIFFSIFNILEYILLVFVGIEGIKRGGKDAFLAFGFIFNFPGLLFSILALHYLNMKEIKVKFIRK